MANVLGLVIKVGVGALGAAFLDSRYPDKALHVLGVTLEPGAVAGVAAVGAALAGLPGASVLGAVGAGAVGLEVGRVASSKLLPGPVDNPTAPGASKGTDFVGGRGYPALSSADIDRQISATLEQFSMMA